MAFDAVRRRPLIVARSTREQIATCRSPMKCARPLVPAQPAGRVWARGVSTSRADPASHMTAIAARAGVAGRAAVRLGTSLDRMPRHVVRTVGQLREDGLRSSRDEGQGLREVVAILACRLLMAHATHGLGASSSPPVSSQPGFIMNHERLGLKLRQLGAGVAPRTASLVELRAMALEARVHGGPCARVRAFSRQASVAPDTLAPDDVLFQVRAVREVDDRRGVLLPRAPPRKRSVRAFVAVAAGSGRGGSEVAAPLFGTTVAARAVEAGWLSRKPTLELYQMLSMGESCRLRALAGERPEQAQEQSAQENAGSHSRLPVSSPS